MSTPRSQRVGIWIIAIVLTIGTFGSFLAMILSFGNQNIDKEAITRAQKEYQQKVDKQNKELSDKYYSKLSQYLSKVGEFNPEDVKTVQNNDLIVGDGDEIKSDTPYSAYYIGWNPKGVIFDQSIDGATLKPPISGSGLIAGWVEAVQGMKIGGIREIFIPSEKAYGETGGGDNIPPNTPIKFIVLAIPTPESIELPDLLKQYYGQ